MPLSANAQALWHLLMNMSNRAGWPKTICIAESVLRGMLGISHGSFVKARAELVAACLILHIPRQGKQAPFYLLKTIAFKNVPMSVIKLST